MTEIEILNKKIGAEYVTLDGHQIFRLVWSENILENRHGTFREFTNSGIFVREVTEVRKVRKYNYIHNRWIFEMWAPGNLTRHPELPDAENGDYVPVYVFESRSGQYLPPNEKVVRFLISALYGKVRKDELPSKEYLEEREIQNTMEAMNDHPSWFQTRPGVARNAIWYAGGVPVWDERRASFEPKLVDTVERLAVLEAREKARELADRREAQREKLKLEIEARVKEQEARDAADRARERERERIRAEEQRIREENERSRKADRDRAISEREQRRLTALMKRTTATPIKAIQGDEPQSPMHRVERTPRK